MHRYFLLPIIIIISIGFSSNVFATEDSILYSSESNFDSSFNYNLNDALPLTLDQFTIDPTSDSILSPDIFSTNSPDGLTYSTEIPSSQSMIVSEIGLVNDDEINDSNFNVFVSGHIHCIPIK